MVPLQTFALTCGVVPGPGRLLVAVEMVRRVAGHTQLAPLGVLESFLDSRTIPSFS